MPLYFMYIFHFQFHKMQNTGIHSLRCMILHCLRSVQSRVSSGVLGPDSNPGLLYSSPTCYQLSYAGRTLFILHIFIKLKQDSVQYRLDPDHCRPTKV
jgi:hypothetical protein